MMYLASLCGMSQREFWECTPKFLSMRYKAWNETRHDGWEQARFIAFYVIKTVDSKKRFKKLQDVTRFPWESPPKIQRQTEEELQKFDAEADEVLRLLNPEAYERYMAGKKTNT